MLIKEIYDELPSIKNRELIIILARVLIRLILNINNTSLSLRLLKLFESLFFLVRKLKTGSYIHYLLKINSLKLEYMIALAESNFDSVIRIKTNWAKYIIENSNSSPDRRISKEYLRIISGDNTDNKKSILSTSKASEKEVFYIFGPNAEYPPSIEHPNHRLVLTKPMIGDKNYYKNSILFVNAEFYYQKMAELILSIISWFFNSKEPIMGNIAAPMALGIIIYNLIKKFEMTQCVIKGFDFYTKRETYSKNYPSLMSMKNETINTKKLFLSLADHDPIYDFLYVKNLILKNNIKIINSDSFCEILSFTPQDYFSKLCNSRNFEPLN